MRFRRLIAVCCGTFGSMSVAAMIVGAADPPVAAKLTSAQPETPPADRIVALLQQTAKALESRTIEPEEEPAFRELVAAAEALKAADKPSNEERTRLRGLARVRLQQAADVLRRQEARVAAAAKKGAKPQSPATIDGPQSSVLAQQGLPGGLFGGQQGQQPAAGTAGAEAEKLIDLITGVISPESWEQNGGTGVIRYWALGHALVIRATAEEHDQVGDLAGQLRQAK